MVQWQEEQPTVKFPNTKFISASPPQNGHGFSLISAISLHQVHIVILYSERVTRGDVSEVFVHPVVLMPSSSAVFHCAVSYPLNVDFCAEW